ncbi:hypothetical protein SPFL3102_01171 [Sporomusaceae bacterium FL31]|nr:hypothetical protein SPFL3101_00220 [Sporomusaceae bacterium FL31]GCE33367.1 hypothetical protein SPFL3102_01171 [Sporomusaceae bacterium]
MIEQTTSNFVIAFKQLIDFAGIGILSREKLIKE